MAQPINDVQYNDSYNVQIVNDFNKTNYSVNGAEYDFVVSFFKKVIKDPVSAKNFTDDIYQVSRQAEIPVLDIVDSLDGQNGLEMTASIAYYLNGIRSNTSLVGIMNIVKPNYYAGRTVLS